MDELEQLTKRWETLTKRLTIVLNHFENEKDFARHMRAFALSFEIFMEMQTIRINASIIQSQIRPVPNFPIGGHWVGGKEKVVFPSGEEIIINQRRHV